jgi:HEAT repeat protein
MPNVQRYRRILLALIVVALATSTNASEESLRSLVLAGNFAAVKEMGQGVLPQLMHLYDSAADETERARIANAFYQLGWKSDDARRVLLKDVHTSNQELRLAVQYALGRVSDDPGVVDALLANMQDDANPLFRDKAACALAYDQIHLSEAQKVRLYAGLIHALRDAKPQVRAIAIQALEIHTGQRKGFFPQAPDAERAAAIAAWEAWIARYQENLR